ncbi:MAG: glutathione transferase GstA [Rhizobiales bacterium]|nr:glutathione transferase GstA [Hyphomicrobiales bacterium]
MKLYYSPGACSLASHIALAEVGAKYTIEKVNTKTKEIASGGDFWKVNPNGYVPALEIAGGEVLTEGPAILTYIAETHPAAKLVPATPLERARHNSLLNFVGSELHKAFSPFFSDKPEGAAREKALAKLKARMGHIERQLADGRTYLTGSQFTVADAYAFVVAKWSRFIDLSLDEWPHVKAFVDRVAARPAVQQAMREEGLL